MAQTELRMRDAEEASSDNTAFNDAAVVFAKADDLRRTFDELSSREVSVDESDTAPQADSHDRLIRQNHPVFIEEGSQKDHFAALLGKSCLLNNSKVLERSYVDGSYLLNGSQTEGDSRVHASILDNSSLTGRSVVTSWITLEWVSEPAVLLSASLSGDALVNGGTLLNVALASHASVEGRVANVTSEGLFYVSRDGCLFYNDPGLGQAVSVIDTYIDSGTLQQDTLEPVLNVRVCHEAEWKGPDPPPGSIICGKQDSGATRTKGSDGAIISIGKDSPLARCATRRLADRETREEVYTATHERFAELVKTIREKRHVAAEAERARVAAAQLHRPGGDTDSNLSAAGDSTYSLGD